MQSNTAAAMLPHFFTKPQIRDFPHEVLQTEEKCAFD